MVAQRWTMLGLRVLNTMVNHIGRFDFVVAVVAKTVGLHPSTSGSLAQTALKTGGCVAPGKRRCDS